MSDKIKRIFCIAIGLVMGGWLAVYGTRELINSKRLADHGKAAQARVVDLRETVSGRLRRHAYYLTIAFETPGGSAVTKEVKVGQDTFTTAQVGSAVKAYYLAEDPTVCAAGQTVDLRYGNLLFGLVVLAGAVFLWVTRNRSSEMDDLAEKIEGHLKPLMVERFDYAPVRAQEFGHLDLAFYDNARRHLEERGYSFLADEENVTLRKQSGERNFLRLLVSREQTVVAFLYHVKARKASGKDSKVLDLETWFSNRQFVCTSNAAQAGVFDSPPSIHALHLPAEASWDAIREAHQKQVTDFLAKSPGVEPIKLKGMEEVRRFQDNLQRTKAEFRRNNGLSKAELERLVRGRAGIDVEGLHAKLAERLKQYSPAPVPA
ncbi:MAG TPA: DUF3592 domain-containing protein [Candidatus Binatia bacterium]|jgi:hypothetical protein|nr:DUF3592 domain-containing protein [Candidatus Binatia bacterium]